jgi:hypothetical protein
VQFVAESVSARLPGSRHDTGVGVLALCPSLRDQVAWPDDGGCVQSDAADDAEGAITRWLNSDFGVKASMDQVFPIVYRELKTIAQRLLARGGSATVTPTVLVHELYGKLHGAEQLSVEGRAHFF